MEKNIKDYLHLYLGCKAFYYNKGFSYEPKEVTIYGYDLSKENNCVVHTGGLNDKPSWFKPILRPLSDMTEEEKGKTFNVLFPTNKQCANWTGKIDFIDWLLDISDDYPSAFYLCEDLYYAITFKEFAAITSYLRKDGFDVDGLIEAGLAIDKTKNL